MISLKNAIKIYANNHKALNNISFTLQQGEIIGLLGVNGSGKTTCSGILAGLHCITSGEVLYQGNNIKKHVAEYRKNVGYCPQHSTLNDNITVYDNLLQNGLFHGMNILEAKKATKKIIALLNMQEYADKLPSTLSGGWIQRVMIARALVPDPKFIILDEPTVGLDPHIRHTIWEVIKMLKQQKKTILLTTHYLDEADLLCDQIIIIDHGKVVSNTTKDALKKAHKNKTLEEIFIKLIGQDKKNGEKL